MTSKLPKFVVLLLILLASGSALADDSALFPQPAALDRDVNFWVSIFTKYSTKEGVLHDNRNLGVVYESVPLPDSSSRRARQRASSNRRKHYQAILRTLASGKRDNLTTEEQRVLDLWPADVTNQELSAAVGRIRFQLGLSDRFQEGLERAGLYRDHVNAEFTRHGVPTALAALPHVESSYNLNAQSHVGASGIWQFTRSTGRRFMQVDHVLDERNDPFLATTGAAKLLAYNYSLTGNWPMAITAYNHGLAGARRAQRRHGDTAYVDILRNYNGRTFGFASRNFYVAFLAAKHVDQNAEKYFPNVVPKKPIDYTIVRVPAYVAANKVAEVLDINERTLREHNRALQGTVWQGSKHIPKDFQLRIPTRSLDAPVAELMSALGDDDLHADQLPDMFHKIQRGDTLSQIADTYGTRVSTLVALNNLGSSHRIRAGQQLRLPAAGPAPATATRAQPSPTPQPVAEQAPVVAANVSEPGAEPAPESAAEPGPETAVDPVVESMAEADPVADIVTGDNVEAGIGDQVNDYFGSVQAGLLSDPSDYTVDEGQSIEVHPLETLGHYADWLGIRTQRLRDINGLAFRTPVEVGQRIKLDFGTVSAEAFEAARNDYHRAQQDTFFRTHTITGVTEHVVESGESVWILALRKYDVPVWLFRQYNPELDLHNVRRGTRLSFPVLAQNSTG